MHEVHTTKVGSCYTTISTIYVQLSYIFPEYYSSTTSTVLVRTLWSTGLQLLIKILIV